MLDTVGGAHDKDVPELRLKQQPTTIRDPKLTTRAARER
jgi:hypothetical protein